MLVGIVVLLVVAGMVWVLNSPGFRVGTEIYSHHADLVRDVHYGSTPAGDTLTITMARDVDQAEARAFACEVVIPALEHEHISPRVILVHPDGSYRLEQFDCE